MAGKVFQPEQTAKASSRAFRRRGPQPIADLVGDMLGPAAKKRGFASVDLFAYWPDIVGAAFADHTQPERLNWPRRLADDGEQGFEPATLTVRCEGGRAILFQYEERAIVERINQIFGFRAVAKLRIVQMPILKLGSRRPKPLRGLAQSEEAALAGEVAGISDDGLRDALLKLGRAVRAKAAPAPTPRNKEI